MQSPAKLKTNQDKLKYFYRAKELLRLEHNAKGAEVGKTITLDEFRDWQKNDWEPRSKNVLNEINLIKEAEGITQEGINLEKKVEFEALKAQGKEDTSFDKGIDIKTIKKIGRGYPVVDPVEDFTTYTEVDPGTKVTVASTKVSWTDVEWDDAFTAVYSDKGADHFAGDFEHLLTIYASAIDIGGIISHYQLSNVLHGYYWIDNNAENGLFVMTWRDGSASYKIRAREFDAGTGYQDTYDSFLLNTPYYLKISRDEAVGTYGTYYVYIYSDSSRTVLVDTLSIALHTSKKDYRYVFAMASPEADTTTEGHTGYTENLDLQEGGGITISESLTLVENRSILAKMRINNIEQVILNESISALGRFRQTVSEVISLTEEWGGSLFENVIRITETLVVNEIASLKASYRQIFSETISLVEKPVSVLGKYIISVGEILKMNEIVSVFARIWEWTTKHTSNWTFGTKHETAWTEPTKHTTNWDWQNKNK